MPKRPITAEDLLRIEFVGDPQVSPDGTRILFSKRHIVADKNKYVGNLFTVDVDTGTVTQWTQGEAGAGGGRWSPDGQSIAFVAGRDKPAAQIYLLPTTGGEGRKLTSLAEGSIGEMRWSPDGTQIAFTFRPQHEEWTEKAAKEREAKGLSTPARVFDNAWYRLDGDGYFGPQRFAVYVVDVATGEHRLVYDRCPMGFYSFDWSPDSKELAIAHTVAKNPWQDKPDSQIFRVAVADGQAWKLEGLPKGDKGGLRWSPDGMTIAYLGDDTEDDPWGVRNVNLFIVAAEGGTPRCLTRDDDYCLSVMGLSDTREAYGYAMAEWTPDSKGLYLSIGWHGETQLGFVEIERSRVELLSHGPHTLTIGNLSASGERIACLYGNATRVNEVAVLDLNKLRDGNVEAQVLTHFNQEFHNQITLIEPEEVWIESEGGVKVQAWVIKPVGYLEPKRYPAVLEIHGGPHAQYGWAIFHEFQLLAANGYVVVYSNPRGSKGYGEAFCAAIRGNWGGPDWEDIQAVTRWMQHQPYIHPGQMGVMGGSYGGYMTNWVVGHCQDFKAAITDRCVSNLVSMAGNCDFPINRDGYWPGHAWGDLAAITELWRQSPISYFDKVETPMLIIHSEGDLRCNVEQAEQVFTALQVRGIESRFVRYPVSTSHGMSRGGPPDLRLHRLGEILRWWEKHLKI
ncbi:MAG TPA: S9 family peptidase [Fimbriimonadaceae bacterium]|nr:S9 family peptidase [Fimbriimonadaceae bacterium]